MSRRAYFHLYWGYIPHITGFFRLVLNRPYKLVMHIHIFSDYNTPSNHLSEIAVAPLSSACLPITAMSFLRLDMATQHSRMQGRPNGSPTRNGLAEPGPPATNVPHPNDRGRPPSVGVRNLGNSRMGCDEIETGGYQNLWNLACLISLVYSAHDWSLNIHHILSGCKWDK